METHGKKHVKNIELQLKLGKTIKKTWEKHGKTSKKTQNIICIKRID